MDANRMNRLAREASPYLRQHAGNPVDWFPWGDEAFAEAARRDLPVFLSVGYAACHWCHVMERESFVDPATAALLNRTFVCVKVDREERPDLDHLYMSVCQLMTGSGGWPLTVLLTAARLPFHAGTYLPPRARGGRPGLDALCAEVDRLWRSERPRLLQGALDLQATLARWHEGGAGGAPAAVGLGLDAADLAEAGAEEACRQLEQRHDARHGGFGGAPKFPSPHNLGLLLRRGWDEATQAPRGDAGRQRLDMALGALLAMARGGLRDQLRGGFHRYSTDAQWRVPHFEKMLYDQATLGLALADGVQVLEALARRAPTETADRLRAEQAELLAALRDGGDYVLRELADPAGGFYSAEDADSEGEEGRFYAWDWAELEALLAPADLPVAALAWGLSPEGNWPDEGTGRHMGRNVLCPGRAPAEAARQAGLEPAEFAARLARIRQELLQVRAARPRPARDDKVLADWNGLTVAALARAAAVEGRPAWLAAAARCAGFLVDRMRREDGSLWHRWRGEPGIPGMLDDYAMVIRGLLELTQAGEPSRNWLAEAVALQEIQDRLFWDEAARLYRLSPADTDLPLRPIEDHDGALPCGNSLSAGNLLRLARLLERPELRRQAEDLTAGLAARAPLGAGQSQLLAEWEDERGRRELTLAGPDAVSRATFRAVQDGRFLPGLLIKESVEERAEARLCLEGRCLAPAVTPAQLSGQLQQVEEIKQADHRSLGGTGEAQGFPASPGSTFTV